jgi:hypothetical protein
VSVPEYDHDTLVRAAFQDFRAAAAPPSAYSAADAHSTVRFRRRVRTVGVAAAIVVALAVPAAVFAAVVDGPQRREVEPAVSATVEPSPSGTLPSAPATPSGPSAAPARPELTEAELRNATFDVPAWPAGGLQCPARQQKFTDGQTVPTKPDGLTTRIRKVLPLDVTGDGRREAVVLLDCFIQGATQQVVVYDRTDAGQIAPVARVMAVTEPVKHVYDVAAGPDGSVRVEVGDGYVCCGADPKAAQRQWRGYRYQGGEFRQVDGPTTFPSRRPADAGDLVIQASELRFGPPTNGVRSGTLTLTVRSKGPVAATTLSLSFYDTVQLGVFADGPAWTTGCVGTAAPNSPSCTVAAPPLGASATYTFGFIATGAPNGQLIVRVSGVRADGSTVPETNSDDNAVSVALRTTG